MRPGFFMTGFIRAWVSPSVLRTGLGLALGLATGVACNINVVSVFTCLTDEECHAELDDMAAVCEPNSLCTFPDMVCPSGKRWHDRAGDLGGKCYEDSDLLGDTETAAATEGSGSETGGSSGDPATTTGAEGSTTNPMDTGDPDTSGDPPMTDDGGSSSGGAMSCDDQFGAAAGYELCEETAESCSFNATTDGGSCDAMCMMFGSTCITAFTNDMSNCASQLLEVACSEVAGDNICVCAK